MSKKSNLPFFRFEGLKRADKPLFRRFYDFCAEHEVQEDEYYRFGYEAFGVILYKFSKWLMECLEEEGIENVFFFSRDGYIMRQSFLLLPGSEKFRSEYIYVSRRSLRVPLLWTGTESRHSIIFPTRYISIQDLLASVGLEPEEYRDIVTEHGLELSTIVKGEAIENDHRLRMLLDRIWGDIERRSKDEYEKTTAYIRRFSTGEGMAVVDIGWRGTMQKYLCMLLGSMNMATDVKGYYLTLNSDHLRDFKMRGFLGNVSEKNEGVDELRGYIGLIETLFLRTEGSTKCYKAGEHGEIVPELEEYEYFENGAFSWEARSVERLQTGALQFISDYIDSGSTFLDMFSDRMAFHNLHRIATMPKRSDIALFSGFRFYNNGTVSHLARNKTMRHYMFHIKEFRKDFYESRWRIGFMKGLFMIPLPYELFMGVIMRLIRRGEKRR